MPDIDDSNPEEPIEFRYTPYEKWDYKQIIYKTTHEQSWRDMGFGFYEASLLLAKGVARGELREDIEGLASIFLFRHYLELSLKKIVFAGRLLLDENQVTREEVKTVANIHELSVLWDWVLADAKPKISGWEGYDTDFVEKCIAEFDGVDKKGFAFRYSGQGGEFCSFDFHALPAQMRHIQQVLDGIATYLIEARREILEYEAELEQEYGGDWS